MAITISKLKTRLKYKTDLEKRTLFHEFVATLDPREREFYDNLYREIEKAAKEKRHVEHAKQLLMSRKVFIPNPENIGIYFQVGEVINGREPITLAEAIKQMNHNSPRPYKTRQRIPPIFDRTSTPNFSGRQRYPLEDDQI